MGGGAARIGDWELWPDFAVRSAGFPVTGLDAFGAGDESARLREVARDPLFREAVAWQNPAALANAVVKVADNSPTKPSRARLREEVVASYWQRYCGKTDTIGFFGPLAWGRIEPDGPALTLRAAGLVRERAVHFEVWPIQALAETLDPEILIPTCPRPEAELRAVLEAHADEDVRRRGLAALDRLEEGLARVAATPGDELPAALAALDGTFTELTGRDASATRAGPTARGRSSTSSACAISTRRSAPVCCRNSSRRSPPCFTRAAGSAARCTRSAGRSSRRRSPAPHPLAPWVA